MTDPAIKTFVHLKRKPKSGDALRILHRVAAHVKPVMTARHWHITTLAEFFPTQTNLLGTNYGRGVKISLRLRPHYNDAEFLPFEDILGTMLHELTHIVHGPHDAKFYALLDDLNLAYDGLLQKGFKGDDGDVLGGGAGNGGTLTGTSSPTLTIVQAKKVAAERALARARGTGQEGQKLGGAGDGVTRAGVVLTAEEVRRKVAEAARRRAHDAKWCGHGRVDDPILVDEEEESINRDEERGSISQVAQVIRGDQDMLAHGVSPPSRRPKQSVEVEETRAQKVVEVIEIGSDQEETPAIVRGSGKSLAGPESRKRFTVKDDGASEDHKRMKSRGLLADSLYDHLRKIRTSAEPTRRNIPRDKWECVVCTLLNPLHMEECDACGTDRPRGSNVRDGYWLCERCRRFNAKDIWMCRGCQTIKTSS